jgi:hypothetical protein
VEDRPTTGRRRKNTRRWCRGVEGREHDPEITIPENRRVPWNRPCHPSTWLRSLYSCRHVEQCRVCGKVLREGWQLDHPAECPDYHPATDR